MSAIVQRSERSFILSFLGIGMRIDLLQSYGTNVPYDSAEYLTFLVGLGCCNKIHRLNGLYNRYIYIFLTACFFFPSGIWNSRKTSTSVSLTMLQPLTVDHNKLQMTLREMGIPGGLVPGDSSLPGLWWLPSWCVLAWCKDRRGLSQVSSYKKINSIGSDPYPYDFI